MTLKITKAILIIIPFCLLVPSKAAEDISLILVSRGMDGLATGGGTTIDAISADGRYVAFISSSDNLIPGDTDGMPDLFVFDRANFSITHASVATDGAQGDGYVWGIDDCQFSMSADGRYVAFLSSSTNLVPNDTNGQFDVFVRDLFSYTTTRVSVASDGTEAINGAGDFHISPNGQFVAFITGSVLSEDDIDPDANIYVHDRETGTTEYLPIRFASCPVVSSDGRYIAFLSKDKLASVTNYEYDNVFVYDRTGNNFTLLSGRYDGGNATADSYAPSMSEDGRYIAFVSRHNYITPPMSGCTQIDVYIYDQLTSETKRICTNYRSFYPMVSPNGKYLVFISSNSDMHNVGFYIYNIEEEILDEIHLGDTGTGEVAYQGPSISNDGAFISFQAVIDGLVPEDTNGFRDVFLLDRRKQIYTNHVYLPTISRE